MLAIETKKLTKIFKDKVAVNEIDLRIKQGELFALLGVNGAGKTTTIKRYVFPKRINWGSICRYM